MGGTLASDLGIKETPYDASRPMPDVQLLYTREIPNAPGKSMVGILVTFAPGTSTPPHTHAGAFIAVAVLQGAVFNKMNDDPLKVFKKGESFFENPGCHHVVSDNFDRGVGIAGGKGETAVILATMVVDTKTAEAGLEALVVIDEEYRPKQ
ncbi:hypothetical protein B0O99DRAFT_691429 [Bisporella sp. PMI_857]|nr:hypothetical protein B0O99DRAFT_691429 [Bisporella sp. PMI_857]